ncbi:MAG: aldehyde ferredoxin oxidoreductase N-terminal domain-containing protein [Candidatus Eremiobacterota bacterium]
MHRKILKIDLETKKYDISEDSELYSQWMGGTGAGTKLLNRECPKDIDPLDPKNPVIFNTGPLNGYFPVITKTVAMFKSPLTGNMGESHGGGRFFQGMNSAGFSSIIITGKAKKPCYICIYNDKVEFKDAGSIWGQSASATERILREAEGGKGKLSVARIGPAGERLSRFACVTIDGSRHFGRLGIGAVMGSKNLKGFVIGGTKSLPVVDKKEYNKFYTEIYTEIKESTLMKKYHDYGTSVNVIPLSKIGGLPTRNFSQGYFEGSSQISGEKFASDYLIQHTACAHCPVGCIHIGTLREKFSEPCHYKTVKVSYDHELIYALGSNLSISYAPDILRLLEYIEKQGWDAISMGVTLAWATDAFLHGIINLKQTELPLAFGDTSTYMEMMRRIAAGHNEFYRDLEAGADYCGRKYGGLDLAICFGKNESPGYMTGENTYLGFCVGNRHSHLDNASYSLDQKLLTTQIDEVKQVETLLSEERWRFILNSLVICLFAREIYKKDRVIKLLNLLGHSWDEQSLDDLSKRIHMEKMAFKMANGFDPFSLELPGKLYRVKSAGNYPDEESFKRKNKLYWEMAGITEQK